MLNFILLSVVTLNCVVMLNVSMLRAVMLS
jgi:hypothetical protein